MNPFTRVFLLCSLILGFGGWGPLTNLAFGKTADSMIRLEQKLTPEIQGKTADIWVPLPMTLAGYQTVVSQTHSGNASKLEFQKIGNVRLLHAHWENEKHPELRIKTVLRIHSTAGPTLDHGDYSSFLKSTPHVQTDGIVHETAMKIVGSLTDPDQKAKAIYEWIVQNTTRNPKTRGCGLGDVKSTLESGNLSGKCADLSSLFVGLSRAAGVPAREVFGIRVASSREFPSLGKAGDVSKAQHCRAEYYSTARHEWVPVDPADVRKAILEEKLPLSNPKIQKIRKEFFGHWEGNWAAFNYGRDFVIQDGSRQLKVNYLMYPMLVSNTLQRDGVDPSEFTYKITSSIE